jgi:hypothetical protein
VSIQRVGRLLSVALLLSSCATVQQPEVPFQTLGGVPLSNEDKADILEIARLVSDKRIEKVAATYALPTGSVIVAVAYETDAIGTYVIDTTLRIHEKHSTDDSSTITRGKWSTKPDLFRRDVLRIFNIDGTSISLGVPDGMSYQEMVQLLQAIKKKEVIWEDKRPTIKDFAVENVTGVTLEGRERLLVISIYPIYFVYARFEGAKLVIKRSDMVIY